MEKDIMVDEVAVVEEVTEAVKETPVATEGAEEVVVETNAAKDTAVAKRPGRKKKDVVPAVEATPVKKQFVLDEADGV